MSKFLNLSEASSIAIHGMVLLVKSDKPLNVSDIAEKISASKHHVAKVFQRLVKYDYVKSLRGPTGGFSLKIDPATISLLDIYEAIEGKVEIHEHCPFGKDMCPFEGCIFNNFIHDTTLQFKEFMENRMLSSYAP